MRLPIVRSCARSARMDERVHDSTCLLDEERGSRVGGLWRRFFRGTREAADRPGGPKHRADCYRNTPAGLF